MKLLSKRRIWIVGALLIAGLIFAACSVIQPTNQPPEESAAPAEDNEASATDSTAGTDDADTGNASTESSGSSGEKTFVDVEILPASNPPFNTGNWDTDFTRRTVEWSDILSGGPPKDGIPAVDNPTFESVDAAGNWLTERDPVIVFEQNGEVKGYPLAILIWHEIVNDTVGGMPVAVTFCPLCNASIVFDATLDGEVLDFGTTGKLRNSDLIMYDRQSETWWQQFTGEAIVGEAVGRKLNFLPSQVISFGDFADRFPEGQMQARPPASRNYGRNPYTGYDSNSGRPFLYNGELDDRLQPTDRVVGVDLNGAVMAYPFATAAEAGAINDELNDTPIVVFHKEGTASALDNGSISDGKDIGSVGVFDRRVDEQTLTFSANGDGTFTDAETGSTWNILGEAIDGELTGAELDPALSFDHFWFAWAGFFPETGLYQ